MNITQHKQFSTTGTVLAASVDAFVCVCPHKISSDDNHAGIMSSSTVSFRPLSAHESPPLDMRFIWVSRRQCMSVPNKISPANVMEIAVNGV